MKELEGYWDSLEPAVRFERMRERNARMYPVEANEHRELVQ